jgi:hypothetical protein
MHNHGTARPCNIRCGLNEGLYIRNDEANVSNLFTDGLANCAQVIFRNGEGTFTCHISGGAPNPIAYLRPAYWTFVDSFGAVTTGYVVSSDNATMGNRLDEWLTTDYRVARFVITRIKRCGGCAINVSTGVVRPTPASWNTTQPGVAGWLTAQDLINLRLVDAKNLGDAFAGDYRDGCPDCG